MSTDFDDAPPTFVEGPVPLPVAEAVTAPQPRDYPKDVWWEGGRAVGRAEGRSEILAALEDALLAAGVAPADVPAILEKVLDRAEGRVIPGT